MGAELRQRLARPDRVDGGSTSEPHPTAAALHMVTSDEALRSALSSPVLAIVQAVDVAVGPMLGLGQSVSAAGLDALEAAAGLAHGAVIDAIASAVGELADSIPFVGAVISMGTTAVNLFLADVAAFRSVEALANRCARIGRDFAPIGTGSLLGGGATTPADLFVALPLYKPGMTGHGYRGGPERDFDGLILWDNASAMAAQKVRTGGGPTVARSINALVLMQITEGVVVDEEDAGWSFAALGRAIANASKAHNVKPLGSSGTAHDARAAWLASIARDLRLTPLQWAKARPKMLAGGNFGNLLNGDNSLPETWTAAGVFDSKSPAGSGDLRGKMPAADRARFRVLRRGIEACYGPRLAHGVRSDGGSFLWTVYVDLLVAAFRKGYLSPEYATFCLARNNGYNGARSLDNPSWPLWNGYTDEQIVNTISVTAAPPTWIFGEQFTESCPANMVASLLVPLVRGWQNTIAPYYAGGAQQLRTLTQQTLAVARRARSAPVVATSGAGGLTDLLIQGLGDLLERGS